MTGQRGSVHRLLTTMALLKRLSSPDERKTQWRFENNGENISEKRLTVTQESGRWKSWVFLGALEGALSLTTFGHTHRVEGAYGRWSDL